MRDFLTCAVGVILLAPIGTLGLIGRRRRHRRLRVPGYPARAAIFVAQFCGVDPGGTDHLLIAVVSVVGSAATAGVTGAVVS